MYFDSLKEKCEYYRNREDDVLLPNTYVLCMLDGRSFSKIVKRHYKLPFDDTFINMMNETAKYVCEQVQGAQFAYTQSDEISILITDFKSEMSDPFFGYRKCKLLSIIAALATAKFNRLLVENVINTPCSTEDLAQMVNDIPLATFDCKVWNVPTANDAFAWFLYRQIDCVRNSKQQTAQTYLPHKDLVGKDTDTQIKLCNELRGIDWNKYDDGKKFGRFITRELKHYSKTIVDSKGNERPIEFDRNEFTAKPCNNWTDDNTEIKSLIPELR